MRSLEYFIAKRLFKDRKNEKRISKPAVVIAVAGMAIGLVVMIVSLCVVIGFKNEVRAKIIGFGAHIQIQNISSTTTNDLLPVEAGQKFLDSLATVKGVAHVQRYTTKFGMMGTRENFQGFMLKGVAKEYNLDFYKRYLIEGEVPLFTDSAASNKVLISSSLSQRMEVGVGDKISVYFLQDNIRARRLTVAGIYQTNFSEFDNYIIITDLYTANRLNGWNVSEEATGIELLVDDYGKLDEVTSRVHTLAQKQTDRYGGNYVAQSVEELYPNFFGWLDVLDTNVWVILVIILGVAGFTIISGLLILILERTNMIGILKAMGAQNLSIRKIFLYFSLLIIGRGMIIGNIVGLSLCLLQQHFGFIKLDPSMYYLDRVPIEFNWLLIVLLNVCMFVVSVGMLVAPSALISHIRPTKAIRFE